MILGINASRARSGGAKAHLIGILNEGDPTRYGFREVHVWTYPELLEVLPHKPWLVKHSPIELEMSILRQLWWERFSFPKELQKAGCSILLNVDAGTVSSFRPAVTMSRDMLSYEPGEIERYGFSKKRLRLIFLRYVQNQSLRLSDGAIFLTRYAANVIQQSCGSLANLAFIPHGVSEDFKKTCQISPWPKCSERPLRCLYVSPVWEFKHQWVVVRAIEALRKRGHDISLTLVGGGDASAQRLLDQQVRKSDAQGIFIQQIGAARQSDLPGHLANADFFVFASSCENMPNTLLEAMAVGLPIACSDRGPMPEVLQDGGVYFDPEDDISIASAIDRLIMDEALRISVAKRAKSLSKQYSWHRCADETWTFIAQTFENHRAS